MDDAFVSVSCRHEYRVNFSLNFTVAVALATVSILWSWIYSVREWQATFFVHKTEAPAVSVASLGHQGLVC